MHDDPDFAWHQSVLVNQDRLCHIVNTQTTRARASEIKRIESLSKITEQTFCSLSTDIALQGFITNLFNLHVPATMEE